jgi:hypothetical protein
MLFKPTQPTLVNVFQLLECIEMNKGEECVMTLGFSKDNLKKNNLASVIQQPHGLPNKVVPPKTKGGQIGIKWCLPVIFR